MGGRAAAAATAAAFFSARALVGGRLGFGFAPRVGVEVGVRARATVGAVVRAAEVGDIGTRIGSGDIGGKG